MKKILLLLLIALSFSMNTQAQLADGSIAPDFTATDINGVEHNLYDLLDQGKSVVLDVSATWCPPCWSYHQGGVLEDLWETYGPEGTDEVYIFMIEGDASTTQADLEGTTAQTMGDWITGTHYPIIDNDDIADLYEISYFPTLYHICPNRIVTETAQFGSAESFMDLSGNCQSALGENNSGILSYTGFEGTACGEVVFTPSVMIQNLGTEMMTSADIELALDNDVIETINWTGSLNTFQTEIITFSDVTATPSVMTIAITMVNGNTDEEESNNIFTTEITAAPVVEMDTLIVEITTDNYGDETYWAVVDDMGLVIVDGGNSNVGFANINTGQFPAPSSPDAYGNAQTYTTEVIVPESGCYKLIVTDYYGDGICCDYGNGSYTLTDNLGAVYASGGAFEGRADEPFEKMTVVSNEEVLIANKFEIYPNPVNDQLTVEFGLLEATKVNFEVVNTLGQVVVRQEGGNLINGEHIINMDMSRLQAGIYFVNLHTELGVTTQRVIKQ